MIDDSIEDIGLVKCEATGLYGNKEDMVEKTKRIKEICYYNYIFSSGSYTTTKTVYYSRLHIPKWDVADFTEDTPKYYKIIEKHEVLIK